MSSFQGRQRRLVRRRLTAASGEVAGEETVPAAAGPAKRSGRLYADKALPEHQPSPATRLPAGALSLTAATLGLLLVPGLLTGLAVSEPQWAPLAEGIAASRWTATLQLARQMATLSNTDGIAAIVGQWCLLLAAATAVAIRHMRQHRLDDYQGRYRAWGWLALTLTIASMTFILPIDRLVTTVANDAFGWQAGPDGRGWWVGLVALMFVLFGSWAVLPLTQRLSGLWLALSLGGWIAAEAIDWRLAGQPVWQLAAAGLRAFVGPLAAIGMLHAARGVIREARGLVPAGAKARRHEQAGGGRRDGQANHDEPQRSEAERLGRDVAGGDDRHALEKDIDDDRDDRTGPLHLDANGDTITRAADLDEEETIDDAETDGEADDGRQLSKAERRRLRKLARRNRAA